DWFANDMASKNYFPSNHEDSLGRGPGQRGAAFGYPWGVGENSGAGGVFSDPQAIFDAWRGSPGHNSNMLKSIYSMAGIGVAVNSQSNYGWYWVLDLGTVLTEPGPAPTPAPTPTPAATPAPTASPSPPPTSAPQTPTAIRGDANCDFSVGSLDALTLLRAEAGYDVESECLEYGNVDCDGDRDALDALAILRWVVSQPMSINEDCAPIGVPV
ncbi:MAG: CAP domain-containing protein, partial [Candidatus Binatia bacterium]